MAHRTISGARQWLDDTAKQLNPEAFRQYNQEIHQVEAEAKVRATAHVQSIYDDQVHRSTAVSQDLCTIRDKARELTEQIRTGRISATDAGTELEALRSQARNNRTATADLTAKADQMDAVETEPVVWFDQLATSFPHMLTDYSF